MRWPIMLGGALAFASCGPADRQSAQPDAVQSQPTARSSNAGAAKPAAPAAAPKAGFEPAARTHPCLVQDGKPVTRRLKALGTEPFWAAEVEGRCIIYRTPEDQAGTRVWTRASAEPPAEAWDGALHGRQFRLVVRAMPGCSDGMSDKAYPMEAVLRVDGETRRGCAEPL